MDKSIGFETSKAGEPLFFGNRKEALKFFISEDYLDGCYETEKELEEMKRHIKENLREVESSRREALKDEFVFDDAIEIWTY